MKPIISVIIPALNEAHIIENTLKSLSTLQEIKEIIVVDGGSQDQTPLIASLYAKVIQTHKGRAVQMNAGAREATGDILLFLHADTVLNRESFNLLQLVLKSPDIAGGGFRVEFDDNSLLFKLIAWGSNLRSKWFKIFFGDQGIFVKKSIFDRIGGYPEIPLMEEWELCRKLRAYGKLVQVPACVLTSSRRWHKHGVWKTILLMHKLKLLYLLGVSPFKLKKMYLDN